MAPDRLKSLDILRSAAIVFILLAHLPAYAPGLGLDALEFYFVTLGIGFFIFVSGYALCITHPNVRTFPEIKSFLAGRALRIYPLYLPALFTFVALFGVLGFYHRFTVSPFWATMIVHLTGGQELLAPRLVPLPTLWFIGLIVMYYIVYIVVMRFGATLVRTLLAGVVILAMCVIVRFTLGLIGNRFFLYFPVFLAGILAGRSKVLSGLRLSKWSAGLSLLTMATCAILLWPLRPVIYDSQEGVFGRMPSGDGLRLLFMASGITSGIALAEWWQKRMSRRTYRVVFEISLASYATYLYHRPVLSALASLVKRVGYLEPSTASCAVMLLGVPLVFVLGRWIQGLEKHAMMRLMMR